MVAWLTKRKITQFEDHRERVDNRLAQMERDHVSHDTLNRVLDEKTEAIHEDIKEIKSGQAEIMRTLITVIRDRNDRDSIRRS